MYLFAVVDCGLPPAVDTMVKASVTQWLPRSNSTVYLSTVTISCNAGSWLSDGSNLTTASSTCQANATWSSVCNICTGELNKSKLYFLLVYEPSLLV